MSDEAGTMGTFSKAQNEKTKNPSRITRKFSCLDISSCFSSKRRRPEASDITNEKPKYVHIPQHAADSFLRTTTPVPFHLRPIPEDVTIEPVKTPAQKAEEMRQVARHRAAEGGRVHIVGSSINNS